MQKNHLEKKKAGGNVEDFLAATGHQVKVARKKTI